MHRRPRFSNRSKTSKAMRRIKSKTKNRQNSLRSKAKNHRILIWLKKNKFQFIKMKECDTLMNKENVNQEAKYLRLQKPILSKPYINISGLGVKMTNNVFQHDVKEQRQNKQTEQTKRYFLGTTAIVKEENFSLQDQGQDHLLMPDHEQIDYSKKSFDKFNPSKECLEQVFMETAEIVKEEYILQPDPYENQPVVLGTEENRYHFSLGGYPYTERSQNEHSLTTPLESYISQQNQYNCELSENFLDSYDLLRLTMTDTTQQSFGSRRIAENKGSNAVPKTKKRRCYFKDWSHVKNIFMKTKETTEDREKRLSAKAKRASLYRIKHKIETKMSELRKFKESLSAVESSCRLASELTEQSFLSDTFLSNASGKDESKLKTRKSQRKICSCLKRAATIGKQKQYLEEIKILISELHKHEIALKVTGNIQQTGFKPIDKFSLKDTAKKDVDENSQDQSLETQMPQNEIQVSEPDEDLCQPEFKLADYEDSDNTSALKGSEINVSPTQNKTRSSRRNRKCQINWNNYLESGYTKKKQKLSHQYLAELTTLTTNNLLLQSQCQDKCHLSKSDQFCLENTEIQCKIKKRRRRNSRKNWTTFKKSQKTNETTEHNEKRLSTQSKRSSFRRIKNAMSVHEECSNVTSLGSEGIHKFSLENSASKDVGHRSQDQPLERQNQQDEIMVSEPDENLGQPELKFTVYEDSSNPSALKGSEINVSLTQNKIRSSLRNRKCQINWHNYLKSGYRKNEDVLSHQYLDKLKNFNTNNILLQRQSQDKYQLSKSDQFCLENTEINCPSSQIQCKTKKRRRRNSRKNLTYFKKRQKNNKTPGQCEKRLSAQSKRASFRRVKNAVSANEECSNVTSLANAGIDKLSLEYSASNDVDQKRQDQPLEKQNQQDEIQVSEPDEITCQPELKLADYEDSGNPSALKGSEINVALTQNKIRSSLRNTKCQINWYNYLRNRHRKKEEKLSHHYLDDGQSQDKCQLSTSDQFCLENTEMNDISSQIQCKTKKRKRRNSRKNWTYFKKSQKNNKTPEQYEKLLSPQSKRSSFRRIKNAVSANEECSNKISLRNAGIAKFSLEDSASKNVDQKSQDQPLERQNQQDESMVSKPDDDLCQPELKLTDYEDSSNPSALKRSEINVSLTQNKIRSSLRNRKYQINWHNYLKSGYRKKEDVLSHQYQDELTTLSTNNLLLQSQCQDKCQLSKSDQFCLENTEMNDLSSQIQCKTKKRRRRNSRKNWTYFKKSQKNNKTAEQHEKRLTAQSKRSYSDQKKPTISEDISFTQQCSSLPFSRCAEPIPSTIQNKIRPSLRAKELQISCDNNLSSRKRTANRDTHPHRDEPILKETDSFSEKSQDKCKAVRSQKYANTDLLAANYRKNNKIPKHHSVQAERSFSKITDGQIIAQYKQQFFSKDPSNFSQPGLGPKIDELIVPDHRSELSASNAIVSNKQTEDRTGLQNIYFANCKNSTDKKTAAQNRQHQQLSIQSLVRYEEGKQTVDHNSVSLLEQSIITHDPLEEIQIDLPSLVSVPPVDIDPVQSILRTAQQTVIQQSGQNLRIVQVIKVKYQ